MFQGAATLLNIVIFVMNSWVMSANSWPVGKTDAKPAFEQVSSSYTDQNPYNDDQEAPENDPISASTQNAEEEVEHGSSEAVLHGFRFDSLIYSQNVFLSDVELIGVYLSDDIKPPRLA